MRTGGRGLAVNSVRETERRHANRAGFHQAISRIDEIRWLDRTESIADTIFSNDFKLICPVQSPLQKYSASLRGQITGLCRAILCPQEGRFAIVTNVG